jgi:hypothetical protein
MAVRTEIEDVDSELIEVGLLIACFLPIASRKTFLSHEVGQLKVAGIFENSIKKVPGSFTYFCEHLGFENRKHIVAIYA